LALAASYDGSIAVGSWWDPMAADPVAVRWGSDGELELLEPTASVPGEAWGVSADGTVIVGWRRSDGVTRAFRWTAEGGFEASPEAGYAYGVSGDGTLVVGCCAPGGPFLWHPGGDFTVLPTINETNDAALGISADGSVVVGGASRESSVAWRWSQAEGTTPLAGPGEFEIPYAHDASAEGSVVVGSDYRFWGESFVWDAEHGERRLEDALLQGFVVSPFARLEETRAVSDDGRRVAATGIRTDGSRIAVLAILGAACDDGLDNDGDGQVDMADPQCVSPSHASERPPGCGLGFELALVLPLLAVRQARQRRRETA
jgi:probable HAF family extracellular repeat protein